jgi:hypothetical protein
MEPSGWAGGGGSASGCRSTASRLFHGSPAPRRVGMMVDVSSRPSCVGWSGVRGACGLEGVAALSEVGVVAPRACSSPPSSWRWGRPKGPLRLLHVEDRGRSLGQPSGSSPPGAPHLVLSRPRLFIARAHGLSEAVVGGRVGVANVDLSHTPAVAAHERREDRSAVTQHRSRVRFVRGERSLIRGERWHPGRSGLANAGTATPSASGRREASPAVHTYTTRGVTGGARAR